MLNFRTKNFNSVENIYNLKKNKKVLIFFFFFFTNLRTAQF